MKTTTTITVESEEGGTRYKISHEGDTLGYEINDLVTAVQLYWSKVQERESARENLLIMKQKRKDMKHCAKDAASYIEEFQTVGQVSERKEEEPFPF